MNFRKVNNMTGWAVFLVALATYMLTREARGSFGIRRIYCQCPKVAVAPPSRCTCIYIYWAVFLLSFW